MNRALCGWAAIAALASTAGAQVVLVDVGGSGGNTPSPSGGNAWNNFNPGSFVQLVDTAGAATGISLNATTGVSVSSAGGLTTPSASLLGDYAVATATQDYAFVFSTGTLGLTLSGLDPTLAYNLVFFGSRISESQTRTTRYSATGGNGTLSTTLVTSGFNIGADGLYDANDDTLARIDGVTAGAGNTIALSVTVAQGGFGYLSAFGIEIVPAPGVAGLAGLGGLAALRRRR